jgi:hypothetical protein
MSRKVIEVSDASGADHRIALKHVCAVRRVADGGGQPGVEVLLSGGQTVALAGAAAERLWEAFAPPKKWRLRAG